MRDTGIRGWLLEASRAYRGHPSRSIARRPLVRGFALTPADLGSRKLPVKLGTRFMTQRERTLRQRFQQTNTRHRRGATAASWFALGALLAEAYEVSPDLGRELSVELGDPITCWRRCVRLAPTHADAWNRLGLAYYKLDDRESAARAL